MLIDKITSKKFGRLNKINLDKNVTLLTLLLIVSHFQEKLMGQDCQFNLKEVLG